MSKFTSLKTMFAAVFAVFYAATVSAAGPDIPESLFLEAKSSIQRGVNYLTDTQEKNGSWLNQPSVTALCAVALRNSNSEQNASIRKAAVEKARKYILDHVHPDGSITPDDGSYVNYTTSICLAALAIINNPADKDVMRKARHFLIGEQITEERLDFLKKKFEAYKKAIDILIKEQDNPFLAGLDIDRKRLEKVYKKYKDYASKDLSKNNPFYGGIGYGSGGPTVPDLSNTSWALEALYLTDNLDSEAGGGNPETAKKSALAWKRAVEFLRKVQRIPESADSSWVVADGKKFDGGFVYQPGYSKVNDKAAKNGTKMPKNKLGYPDTPGLRSYGTMTYAGLKSMIYANLKKDDFRVKAANEWASKHYTLDENPQMGPEGHYYYLHLFSKAHAVMGDDYVTTPDGVKHNWRVDLIKKLLGLQKGKGQWYNDKSGRWWESIPQLSTAYSLIAIEVALGSKIAE
jgi:squalene-hopene/tetraprenyl-beta-curcumene cyclase